MKFQMRENNILLFILTKIQQNVALIIPLEILVHFV